MAALYCLWDRFRGAYVLADHQADLRTARYQNGVRPVVRRDRQSLLGKNE